MDELIAKLETATGPNRELDGRIWAEIDGRDVRIAWCEHWNRNGLLAKSRVPPNDECVVGVFDAECDSKLYTVGQSNPPPAFTTSIDASLTLVPQGYAWLAGDGSILAAENTTDPRFGAIIFKADRTIIEQGSSVSAAIALCIAALKVRAAARSPT